MRLIAFLLFASPVLAQVDIASQQRLARPVESAQRAELERARSELARQQALQQQAQAELAKQQGALAAQQRQHLADRDAYCQKLRELVPQALEKLLAEEHPDLEAIKQISGFLDQCK